MNTTTPLPYRADREVIPVDGLVGKDGFPYLADPHLIAAINAAVVLGRPLLLTGEPGCGKTDFAHAVAGAVDADRPATERKGLFVCQVRSDSQARDLLYHYDALHRFGDAHMDDDSRHQSADARRYVELLPLGEALVAPQRQVVLIDEIDKAPRDLPNDLLRELDEGCFEIKELLDDYPPLPADMPAEQRAHLETRWGQPLRRRMVGDRAKRPIVIITSNVERQLPDAFLRRCLFFHITFPKGPRLTQILRKRLGEHPEIEVPVSDLVDLFLALRAVEGLIKKPATSELIDWAEALLTLHPGEQVRERLVDLAAKLVRSDESLSLPREQWPRLPGMACLLKLREDQALVGV